MSFLFGLMCWQLNTISHQEQNNYFCFWHNQDTYFNLFTYAITFTISPLRETHKTQFDFSFFKWCRRPSFMSSATLFYTPALQHERLSRVPLPRPGTLTFCPPQLLPIPGIWMCFYFMPLFFWFCLDPVIDLKCVPYLFVWLQLWTDFHFQSEGPFPSGCICESHNAQTISLNKVVNSHLSLQLPEETMNCLNWKENVVDPLEDCPLLAPCSVAEMLRLSDVSFWRWAQKAPIFTLHEMSFELGQTFCLWDPSICLCFSH